jgi:hypothetical protein
MLFASSSSLSRCSSFEEAKKTHIFHTKKGFHSVAATDEERTGTIADDFKGGLE